MNQLTEALQGLINAGQGETLNVPHPADIKNVRETPLTEWSFSVLKEDSQKDEDGERQYNIVSGRLISVQSMDEYNEPMGEPRLVLQHRYSHPTRKSAEVSPAPVKPNSIRYLKGRFPKVFEEYERKLLLKGEDLPIAFLDVVPPEVIQVACTMGVRTVRDFAEFDEAKALTFAAKLEAAKLNSRVTYIPRYIEAAQSKVPAAPAKRNKAA